MPRSMDRSGLCARLLLLLTLLLAASCAMPTRESAPPVPASDTEEMAAAPVAELPQEPAFALTEDTLKRGDTLARILDRQGVERQEAHEAIEALREVYDPRKLRSGQRVGVAFEGLPEPTRPRPAFAGMVFEPEPAREIRVVRGPTGRFVAEERTIPLETRRAHALGTIESSLYLAGRDADLPTETLTRLIRIFSFEVDFQRDVRRGDGFEVIYETRHDESGTFVESGDILLASMTLSGRKRTYYRFEMDEGRIDFFDEEGRSARRTLMRTPIDGARLTSGYGMRRHPILGYSRKHAGVDFAAPVGTPILAAGDGVVEEAGWKGSYGRYVRLRHNSTYKTAYAHLKSIARGVRKGARVSQGDVIGYLGASGRVTGPHLHYEVLVNGRQTNPRTIELPSGRTLEGEELARFHLQREAILSDSTTPLVP